MNRFLAAGNGRRLPVFPEFLVAAVWLAASAPAFAQFTPFVLPPNDEGRVLNLNAGLAVVHDSNVPRASSEAAAARFGTDKLSDTYLKGMVGLSFDRMISQQRIRANAQVEGFKYNNYDSFDNVGYNAGVNYDWILGRALFGNLGLQTYRYQPQVQDGQALSGDSPNRIERQYLYFNGGFRFTPSFSAIAGVDFNRRRNSLEVFKPADSDISAVEAGLRYAPGTGLELDFVYRRSDGSYDRLQTQTITGELLITPISNDYKQDEILLRATYRPTEETRYSGAIGQARRKFDQFSDRDFDGIVLRAEADWAITGATTLGIYVARDIEPQDGVYVASYAETTQFRIRPRIRATGRITIEPYFAWYDRKYSGELSGSAAGTRKDKIYFIGVAGQYELRRNVALTAELRRERRDSNFEFADYQANIAMLGVQARF
jgi:exopolysaccharide biosynthesis operon protein EpsL